jgi:glycosyltransferase involved in cell wall biosynthesis
MRVLYFFRGGRRERLASGRKFPKDHFYGFLDFPEGWNVEMIAQGELAPLGPWPLWRKWADEVLFRIGGVRWNHVAWFGSEENLSRLNRADAIVVPTITQGLALSYLKASRRLKPMVFYIATGLCRYLHSPWKKRVIGSALRRSVLGSLSNAEAGVLRGLLGREEDVAYIPFGVDHEFWVPAEPDGANGGGEFILAVGSDIQRDYDFLIKAWKPEYPRLKILTNLRIDGRLPGNVERVRGEYHEGGISDEELLELYRKAEWVAIPLKPSPQPSGQSVALQAMAVGKAVLITESPGTWDSETMIAGKNWVAHRAGDIYHFRTLAEKLMRESAWRRGIGNEGRRTAIEHYTCKHTALAIAKVLENAGLKNGEKKRE